MRDYVRGLLGPVGRKNGWQLAEYAGHATPDGIHHLLSHSRWDADRLRDDLQSYAAEQLGTPEGVLIIDDTGFVKVGLQPPRAELGLMVTEAFPFYDVAPWLALAPVTVLFLLTAAFLGLRHREVSP